MATTEFNPASIDQVERQSVLDKATMNCIELNENAEENEVMVHDR